MWNELLLWSTLWIVFHFILSYFFKKKPTEWYNRIVTLTHSVSICRLIEYYEFSKESPYHRLGTPNMDEEKFVLLLSSGYFVYDTLWCLLGSTEEWLMLVHHLIATIGFPIVCWYGRGGAEALLALWGGELSNPFLQFRWFLKHYNYHGGKIAFLNDLAFAAIFVFIRVVFMSKLCYYFMLTTSMPIITKVLAFGFYVVGILWCFKVLKFAKRKVM